MRVLHVLCDLSGGGAERLVLELCRRSPVPAEVAVVQAGGTLGPAFSEAGVPVRCACRRPGTPGLAAWSRLYRWAREFDVVHTHLFAGDVWGGTAAAVAGTPARVATVHNLDRDDPRWKRVLWTRASRAAHRVAAVSDAAAAWWVAQGGRRDRVVVVPNGVPLERWRAVERSPRRGRVLAVGRLVPQKGLDVLLDAMRELPEATLEVCGDGPLMASLRRRAGPNVRFSGAVDDVPARLSQAEVLVVPSRWEGFGLVAVEAMAAGVPVVATAVDGLREVVGDAGLLVAPERPGEMAAAVRRVLGDRALAARLARAGRERAAGYDIERTAERYAALYEEILGSRGGMSAG